MILDRLENWPLYFDRDSRVARGMEFLAKELDPETTEKRISIAQRHERMRTIIHEFYERERLSPENIKQLGELGEELERRHQEDLQNTLQMAEERLQSDFRQWQEMEPMRREQLQNVLGSEPERIEQNCSMMVD